MTRDDVLRIGRQAGAFIELAQEKDLLWLERFAAQLLEEAAKGCEAMHPEDGPHAYAYLLRAMKPKVKT